MSIRSDVDTLVNRQRFFRRLVLVWAMALITWTVYTVFTNAPVIAAGTATALATVVGILTTIIAFYFRHRKLNEKTNDPSSSGEEGSGLSD